VKIRVERPKINLGLLTLWSPPWLFVETFKINLGLLKKLVSAR
jgi:hypothetical protein